MSNKFTVGDWVTFKSTEELTALNDASILFSQSVLPSIKGLRLQITSILSDGRICLANVLEFFGSADMSFGVDAAWLLACPVVDVLHGIPEYQYSYEVVERTDNAIYKSLPRKFTTLPEAITCRNMHRVSGCDDVFIIMSETKITIMNV